MPLLLHRCSLTIVVLSDDKLHKTIQKYIERLFSEKLRNTAGYFYESVFVFTTVIFSQIDILKAFFLERSEECNNVTFLHSIW